ncbi:MAG TPA: gluconeogenesis factor YvcK family protein [Candidatus Paceibacterota bacterium]|nr:gluconeogenesis factor YvcK family protein [Candidatus Paceibacterota bacterium]
MKKVVTIGGGSSSFAILRGLKDLPLEITSVVNIFDSGSSSGVLRDEFGVLPPGDVRRALVALSTGEQAEIARQLFNFRFNGGSGLSGHSFGNLLIVALSSIYGGDAQAIEKASELLNIKGKVYPVSLDRSHVHAILENGEEIVGETNIDIPKHDANLHIQKVFLDPPAKIYEKADRAIRNADIVVICPGDLYSSLIPTLLSDGMSDALKKSRAKIVWACNMMTKQGETQDFTASHFARELLAYSGIEKFDTVIVNTKAIPPEVLEHYAREQQFPVQFDEEDMQRYVSKIIQGDLLSDTDLVRLDSAKVARIIADL